MPKSAHDHAVAEARLKQYAYLQSEGGERSYVRVVNDRLLPLTDDDRSFLIEQGVIEEEGS